LERTGRKRSRRIGIGRWRAMACRRSKVGRLPVASTRRSIALLSSFTTCGTARSMVTRCSRKVRARTGGWRLVGKITRAPAISGASRPGFSPYMWESGRIERRRVSRPIGTTASVVSALVVTLRWLSMTPFGSPVVPDVKTTTARLSGSTLGRGIGSRWRALSTSDSTVMTGSSSRLAAFSVGTDASTSLARVCAAIFVAISSVPRTSAGTAIAWAHISPRKARAHSGRLTAQIRTRSPRSTPAARRACATRGTCAAMST